MFLLSSFLQFTHENSKAQKYLLGGFEQIVGNVFKDTLMPKVPHILKTFYDLDILDEEVLIEWHAKVRISTEMIAFCSFICFISAIPYATLSILFGVRCPPMC